MSRLGTRITQDLSWNRSVRGLVGELGTDFEALEGEEEGGGGGFGSRF